MDNVFVDKAALQHVVDEMLDREKANYQELLNIGCSFYQLQGHVYLSLLRLNDELNMEA
jgi:hypothetical protein